MVASRRVLGQLRRGDSLSSCSKTIVYAVGARFRRERGGCTYRRHGVWCVVGGIERASFERLSRESSGLTLG